jgi:hypothetical protein
VLNVQYPSQPGGLANEGIGSTPSASKGVPGRSGDCTVWLQTDGFGLSS